MSHRLRPGTPNSPSGSIGGSTIHCKKVQRHILLADAIMRHQQGDPHCFACGRTGDACQKEVQKRG